MEVEESFEELEKSLISLCYEDGDSEDLLTKDLMVPNDYEEMFDLDYFPLVQPSNSLTNTDHVIEHKNLPVDISENENKALHKFQDENIPPKDFNIVKQNKTLDLIFSPSRHSFNPLKCSSPLIPLRVISQRIIPFEESNSRQMNILSNDKDYSKPTAESSNLSFSIYCPKSVNFTSSLNDDDKVLINSPKLEVKKCHELSPDTEITNKSPKLETEKLVVINDSQNLNTAQKPVVEKCCDEHPPKNSDNFEILSIGQKLKAEKCSELTLIIKHSQNRNNEQEVGKSYDKFPWKSSDDIESVNKIPKLDTEKSSPLTLNIDDDQNCNGDQNRKVEKKMKFPSKSSNDIENLKIVPKLEPKKSSEFKLDTQKLKVAQKIEVKKSCGVFTCKNKDIENFNKVQKDSELALIIDDGENFNYVPNIEVREGCDKFPYKASNDIEILNNVSKLETNNSSELILVKDNIKNFTDIFNNVPDREIKQSSELILKSNDDIIVIEDSEAPTPDIKQSSKLTLKRNDDVIVIEDSDAPKPEVKKSYEIPFKSKNPKENYDNYDPEWDKIKNLTTVEERYQQVRSCWKSCNVPDPNKNLTYHSFRKRRIQGIDPIKKIIKSQKRPATTDLDGRGMKRARTKSVPCTFLLDTKIETVRKTKQFLSEKIMKEMNDHLDSLQEYHINSENNVKCQMNNFYDSYGPNPFTSFFNEANSSSLNLLIHQHGLEMRDVTETYRHKIGNCNSQYDSQIDNLKKARLEVKNFCNFYKGLSLTSSDPTLLDEVQLQELNEIENVYDKYKLFYH